MFSLFHLYSEAHGFWNYHFHTYILACCLKFLEFLSGPFSWFLERNSPMKCIVLLTDFQLRVRLMSFVTILYFLSWFWVIKFPAFLIKWIIQTIWRRWVSLSFSNFFFDHMLIKLEPILLFMFYWVFYNNPPIVDIWGSVFVWCYKYSYSHWP